MENLRKLMTHVRNGTLLSRLKKKFGRTLQNPTSQGVPVGDVYRGEAAENYLVSRREQDYWNLEQDAVKRLLNKMENCRTVLDVPFGTGRFVQYYLQHGMDVSGLDSSADMLEVAKRELGDDFHKCAVSVGTAESLPYSNDQFDVSVCFRFLSHVVSYDQAKIVLDELNRVTKKYAILQFRVRNPELPSVAEPLGTESMTDRMSEDQIENLLIRSGFRISKTINLECRDTYFRAVYLCEALKSE